MLSRSCKHPIIPYKATTVRFLHLLYTVKGIYTPLVLWLCYCNFIRLKEKCKHIEVNKQCIIFVVQNESKLDKKFSLILIMAKFCIYRNRCLNTQLSVNSLVMELRKRYYAEKYYHTINCEPDLLFTPVVTI